MWFFLFIACSDTAIPQAPSELKDLCSFIFSRMADDSPEELSKGLENLWEWIHEADNLYQSSEGYQIESLNEADLKQLDEKDRQFRGSLVGVATAYRYNYDVTQVVQPSVIEHWPDVVGEYDVYNRVPDQDPSCLADQSCDWLEYTVEMETGFAGLIDVDSDYNGQVRWVDTSYGQMLTQRTWLEEPASVTPDSFGIEIHEQYFFSTLIPTNCAGTIRISSIWIDTEWGLLPVTEDYGKQLVLENMMDHDRKIDDWLRAN